MSRRVRWLILLSLIGGLVAVAGALYAVYASSATTVPDVGGIYTEGVVGSPALINPLLADPNSVDSDLSALVFSGLTRIGERGEILPDLATGWDISPDSRTYVFRLRPGVQWHDGKPFTARDVLFTIGLMQSPEFPGGSALAQLWRAVTPEQVDELTVKLTLREPFAPLLAYTAIGVLPSHILGGTAPRDLAKSMFNNRPIGTGPFKFRDSTIEFMTLDRNLDYYFDRPYLVRLKLRFFSSYSAALAGLQRHEIQGLSSVAPGDVARLSSNEQTALYAAPRTGLSLLFLNLKSPLFQDKPVRQALAYALDRKKLIDVTAAGQGDPLDGPIPAGSWAYSSAAHRYDFAADKAATLLDGAGWTLGRDGVRARGAQRLEFRLLTNDDPGRVRLAEEIARQLAGIGVRATTASYPPSELITRFLVPRQFDAVVYGIEVGVDPDVYSPWHSSQATADGLNFGGFANRDADRLLESARQTSDVNRRQELYADFQRLFADEAPAIPLYQPRYVYAADRAIQGIRVGLIPDQSAPFLTVADWFMKTRQHYITQDWGLPIPSTPAKR